MEDDSSLYRQIAEQISNSLEAGDRVSIASWVEGLLRIRGDESLGTFDKSRQALEATMDAQVVWPVAKTIGKEIKRLGWDERGTKGRITAVGGAVGLALFAGQGGAVAALGTA